MSLNIELSQPLDVTQDRERFLGLLAKSVDNAAMVGMNFITDFYGMPVNGESLETTEMFDVAWVDAELMENRFWTSPTDGHIVLVRNPHDYLDLLRLSDEKVGSPPQGFTHRRNAAMSHELAHWNAAIRNDIEAALGVKFLNFNGKHSFMAFTSLKPRQEVLVGSLKEVLLAPDTPSTGDLDVVNRLNSLGLANQEKVTVVIE